MAGFERKYPDMSTLRGPGNINDLRIGLLASPLLRAAEMLVCQATHVPSSYEQGVIIDLAYRIADRFNSQHGPVLVRPTQLIAWFETITSLTHPTLKMASVEASRRSSISIADTPKEIELKVSHAVTDKIYGVSYEPEHHPGVSNLLEILAGLEQGRGPRQLADEYGHISHGELKKMVSHAINSEFREARVRYQDLMDKDDSYFDSIVEKGAKIAKLKSEETLRMVKSVLGL
ncbi:hypothetical protein ACJZ2D_003382 [Fusarium nematophilum]